jgi:hypothetical protein
MRFHRWSVWHDRPLAYASPPDGNLYALWPSAGWIQRRRSVIPSSEGFLTVADVAAILKLNQQTVKKLDFQHRFHPRALWALTLWAVR